MVLLRSPLAWDESLAQFEGDDTLRMGLDALASALVDWKSLELRGAKPLDEVLAELGADDAVVETAARLIDLVGHAAYSGGLGASEAEEAERLRASLARDLDTLLHDLEDEENEDTHA
ncbi:MAG: hypothetical protein QM820_09550 [Minicystis sp.]